MDNQAKRSKSTAVQMVLKLKRRSCNTIEKYRLRMVVLGYLQKIGAYNQTFSLVVDFSTVRLAPSIASLAKSDVRHKDLTGAFLYSYLNSTRFMEQPRGFESEMHPEHIWKLRKHLYGLNQTLRAWYAHLKGRLKELEFYEFFHSDSVLRRTKRNMKTVILVYIDDILLITKDSQLIAEVKHESMNLAGDEIPTSC